MDIIREIESGVKQAEARGFTVIYIWRKGGFIASKPNGLGGRSYVSIIRENKMMEGLARKLPLERRFDLYWDSEAGHIGLYVDYKDMEVALNGDIFQGLKILLKKEMRKSRLRSEVQALIQERQRNFYASAEGAWQAWEDMLGVRLAPCQYTTVRYLMPERK